MDARETARTQKRYDRGAALYDLREAPMELMAFGNLRRDLWGGVEGQMILEVGAGTGKNFRHHPTGARVVALDLSPKMLRRAAARAERDQRQVDLVLGDAQRLPFRDAAFDAAAATFVFCSVPDPIAGLQETARVVRPGSRVHLLEHVRSANRVLGRLMDLLNPISVATQGANINRNTVSNVERAGIRLDQVQSHWFGIVKLIRGSPARREGPAAAGQEVANVAQR